MSYAPPPQHFGGPYQSPQPGYGPPPGSPYQQPPYPPQQHGYPPQGGYPPPSQGYPQGPLPAGQYGQPPPQQQSGYGYQGPPQSFGQPAGPSPGYDMRAPLPVGSQGAINDAKALRAAMKGMGTDEKTLIRILSKPDPNQMRVLTHAYKTQHTKSLEEAVHKETSGYFRDGLEALIRGPLYQDAFLLYKGIKGLGTKESFLNDVLCGRSNADIQAIKTVYKQNHRSDLVSDVKADLSLKTETLFNMILAATRAEESTPYDQMAIERDVADLQRAMSNSVDQLTVCSILTSRSNAQIRGISQIYQQKFQTTLVKTISSKFSGHMQDALLLIVARAADGAMSTAEELEATMKGLGTKDELLVQRVVRAHWDRAALDQAKKAYRHRYGRDLISRVKGEVSGDVQRLLVACLE